MLPSNSIFQMPGSVTLPVPDQLKTFGRTDYELGGPVLNDGNAGQFNTVWTCEVVGNTVQLRHDGIAAINLFNRPNINDIALAFTQNMQPTVAWTETDGNGWLRYFDTDTLDFAILNLGPVKTPRLALDDKRPQSSSISDVLLVYVKNNKIVYRQQRDKFQTEYELLDVNSSTTLVRIGMKDLKMHFVLERDVTIVIEDLPEALRTIDITESQLGWMHPTNQYNVPYIINGAVTGLPGKLVFHPGPNLERPTVRWVNTGPAANFLVTLTLTPDGQWVPNTADLVRNGVVIGTSSDSSIFSTTLNMQANESLEIVLSGTVYNGGGDLIDFTATKLSTNESFDMYDAFIANNGAPTAMWQYFYRSNTGYPNGAINSAGPMIKV